MSGSARFDPLRGELVTCIVYDGASGAGKTTNLRKLAELLDDARIEEQAGAELDGVTISFDWLGLRAGTRQGFPVRVTVIGAPGAPGLEAHRRRLLRHADAIVFVCDATPRGLVAASRALELLHDTMADRTATLPVIMQANKQDLPGAAAHARAASELGLPQAVGHDASARDGQGVVDTFLAALHAVGRRIDAAAAAPLRASFGAGALAVELASVPLDPAPAAELLLQAVSAKLARRPGA